jgi:hypothetical protein
MRDNQHDEEHERATLEEGRRVAHAALMPRVVPEMEGRPPLR